MRVNRWIYLHVVQGEYGQGWEDLCASESRKEAHQNAREYRENAPEPIRLIRRREPNPAREGK